MPSDSRVDRVARYAATHDLHTPANFPGTFHDLARATIHTFEAAGIVVIDPDDEATIRRLALMLSEWFYARALRGVAMPEKWKRWADLNDETRAKLAHGDTPLAQAVLAALAVKP